MKKLFFISVMAIGFSLLSACYTNPVTGRKTTNLVSEQEMRSMAATQYKQFLAANLPINGTPDAEMVKRVGGRLATATQQYLASIGRPT